MITHNPLAQLRDIHLPNPIGLWPLAPGWYILLGLFALLLVGIGIWAWRYAKIRRKKRYVLNQLSAIAVQHQKDPSAALEKLSTLVRRLALATYPRHQVAGLKGKAWLKFLDKTGKTQEFTQGIGQHLISAPYQAQTHKTQATVDMAKLTGLIKDWLKQQRF